MKNLSLHKFWWLGIPLLLIIAQIAIETLCNEQTKEMLLQEGGLHENLQAVVMVVNVILASLLVKRVQGLGLKLWFGIAALASFYIAGEELSWGQWIFHWSTPEEWAAINDQNETNLHNTSSWFDQKPQTLLQIGILVGGLIIPLLKIFKPDSLPKKFNAIYGDYHLIPTALIALLLKLIDTLSGIFHWHFFWRISEILELYMFCFVALYLLYMLKKHKNPETN